MADLSKEVLSATAEINEIFVKLGSALDRCVESGDTQVDVAEMARGIGLPEFDVSVLDDLKVDRLVPIIPCLPWHYWYPWRPIWCWWWNRNYPKYHCCPWWWHRCHFHY